MFYGDTHNRRGRDVLSKQDSLRLDHKEVDELVDITNQRIESLPRNGVVLSRSELGSEAIAKDGLSSNLGQDGDAQSHPGKLESVSNDIEVSSHEDQGDDGSICDGGSSYKSLSVGGSRDKKALRGGGRSLRGLFHDSSSEKKEW